MIAELRQALLDYKVVFFREQHLSAEQHVEFAEAFGALEEHPFLDASDSDPRLVRFEKSEEFSGYENAWHSDVSWREVPSMGSILRAVEVPPAGGDTLFADMYAAWEGLAPEVRDFLTGRDAEHDAMRVFGALMTPDEREAKRAEYPTQTHPIDRRHPETGRTLLYVNKVFTERLCGLDDDDSEGLLQFLCNQADLPEYQCRFPLGARLDRLLGQPIRAALCVQRLLATATCDGAGHRHRDAARTLILHPAPREWVVVRCGHGTRADRRPDRAVPDRGVRLTRVRIVG